MTSVSHVIIYIWIMDISYMWSSMTRRVKRHQVPSPVTVEWSLVFSFHGSALPRVHWRWIWCLWNMCSPIHTLGIVDWSKQVKVWHVIHIYMWSIQQHSDITCIDVLITSLSSQVTVKIMKETEKIWVGKYISQCKYPYNIICVEDSLLCSPGSTHRREYQTRGSRWISLTVTRRD